MGQVRLGSGKRSPDSLRYKHLFPSLSHIDMDGFQEKHSHCGVSDGKGDCISATAVMLALEFGCLSMLWLTWSASSSVLCLGAALFKVFQALFRSEVDHHCEPISKDHFCSTLLCKVFKIDLRYLWKYDCDYRPVQFT